MKYLKMFDLKQIQVKQKPRTEFLNGASYKGKIKEIYFSQAIVPSALKVTE
jgi:hypothetical protein